MVDFSKFSLVGQRIGERFSQTLKAPGGRFVDLNPNPR